MSWRDVLNPESGQKTVAEIREAKRIAEQKERNRQAKMTPEQRKQMNCDRRINEVHQICREIDELNLKSLDGKCVVDDWSEYCDHFHLILPLKLKYTQTFNYKNYYLPEDKETWNLRKVTTGVKKVLNNHPDASIEPIYHPKKRTLPRTYISRELGYDKDYTDIELWVA